MNSNTGESPPSSPLHLLQVEQALCGVEALEFLSRSNILPDVILLDIMMPDMNGYEVWGSVGCEEQGGVGGKRGGVWGRTEAHIYTFVLQAPSLRPGTIGALRYLQVDPKPRVL